MSWDEALRAAPPIVQALSILVTAIFAVISLRAWRKQLVGKRRFEVAEEVLTATYNAKGALEWIRNGAVFEGEAADRPRQAGEGDPESQTRDTYYVPIKRIKDASEAFAELQKARLLCKVHFGEEAVQQVEALFRARTSVAVAARMLGDAVGNDHFQQMQADFVRDRKADIWATEDEHDNLTPKIQKAVERIEEICSSYLK